MPHSRKRSSAASRLNTDIRTKPVRRGALALACMMLLGAPAATAQVEEAVDDPMAKPSRLMPLATQGMLLDARERDGRIVAVGEHGMSLWSADGGESWTQGQVPVRSTLTGVYMHDAELGWAVGHDTLIMRTSDGGASWEVLQYLPEEQAPLLDIWFADTRRGIAIGAYGYYFVTSDGGDTWE